MLYKTRGIALNYIKYRETSIIAKIYTESFGTQSYIINGVRTKNSKGKKNYIALYQPLTLLDLVVYKKRNASINHVSEVKCSNPHKNIPIHFKKTSIALFITEILVRVLKEEDEHLEMFDFIQNSILVLDTLEENYENFHLQFLLKLTKFLGFIPQSSNDLHTQVKESGGNISEANISYFDKLLTNKIGEAITISNMDRRILLNILLKFYEIHLNTVKNIRSLPILQEIMN